VADGEDPDFHRGASAYDGWNGDHTCYPGPGATLGPVAEPPFFAAPVHSGTLGTKGGPRTDADSRVLGLDGRPIPGLYAAGNAMAGITGMVYGGAGGTAGPGHGVRLPGRPARGRAGGVQMSAGRDWRKLPTLGDLLVRAVARDPAGRAGVVTPDDRASWADVLIRAERVAEGLDSLGIGGGARVALVAGNSVEGIEAMFACAFLGAVANIAVDRRPGPDPAATAQRIGRLRAQVTLRQTALMVYTSGTTARARGCPLSHEAVVGIGVGVGRDRFRCVPGDVPWDVLPLFHLSFVLPLLAVLDAGGTFVTDRRFDPARTLAQIRGEGVTVAFTCFPTVTDGLLAQPGFGAAFGGVRLMLNVGPPETLRAMQARAPGAVQLTSYGCSEVGGIAATTGPDDGDSIRLGTNGLPLPGMQIAVIDPVSGAFLPPGEPGEIVVRGIGMFEGYWDDPGKTAASFIDGGWFRTGDLGFVDVSGRVSYRGRLKETIKVGGENVAPMKVEAVLAAHPGVMTVAVAGVPDPRYTEVPAAFVELQPSAAVSAEDLLAHCRAALASFKVPRHLRFVTEWPMSATKIQKGELARRLTAELGHCAWLPRE